MNPPHPHEPQEQVVSLYASQKTIYNRYIRGWFANWRMAFVVFTQAIFYGTAWINWDGRQAILLDIADRKFYFFGLTLFPQDVLYLSVILIISAYSLFLFTAVAGRLFCGYACPQSVYSQIFMFIEWWVEGDRNARMARDSAPWTIKKMRVKGTKHFLWLIIAFWTGFTFIGYFAPIRGLFADIINFSLGPWQTFWLVFYSFATWGNAGFLREQVCKYMCPYARFQSVMFDKDTLIVSYDPTRGEPRGTRKKEADYKAQGLGDCVDCGLCVQVCPTGIDIRNGLQYECIGCGLCIDACDSVMDKMNYPRGLIRYTSETGMHQKWSFAEMVKHILRPRIIIYTTILGLIVALFLGSLVTRDPLRANIIRDRSAISRVLDATVQGVYQIRVINTDSQTLKISLTVEGIDGIKAEGNMPFEVPPESTGTFVFNVLVPRESVGLSNKAQDFTKAPTEKSDHDAHDDHDEKYDIVFSIKREGDERVIHEKSTFLVPRHKSKRDDHD